MFLNSTQCEQASRWLGAAPAGAARYIGWPLIQQRVNAALHLQGRVSLQDMPLEQRLIWLIVIMVVAEQVMLAEGLDLRLARHNRQGRRMLLAWTRNWGQARFRIAEAIFFAYNQTFYFAVPIDLSLRTLVISDHPRHRGNLARAARFVNSLLART
jgi:hypothetical protein